MLYNIISNISSYVIPFASLICVVTFFHELGHYLLCRAFNVKVTDFSIGFGKEIIGFKDKQGTRWKISMIPFGGYVKMFGDENVASFGSPAAGSKTPTEEDLKYSIFYKKPYQKFLIALFGPVANFILSFVIFFGLAISIGVIRTAPIITDVASNSIAQKIGLSKNDKILSVNNITINDFQDIKKIILLSNSDKVHIIAERPIKEKVSKILTFDVLFGDKEKNDRILGIMSDKTSHSKLSFFKSIRYAANQIYFISSTTLEAVCGMIRSKNDTKNLGGPIRILEESQKAGQRGIYVFFYFVALVSINLGLVNLFPIPMLDGGQLAISAIEMAIKRPLPKFMYNILFYIGVMIVGFLMLFSMGNDIYYFINK